MKKNILIILISALSLVFVACQTENTLETGSPVFEVDTELIELGEIDVNGDHPADFKVTNSGDAPLILSEVTTSCMCTYAEVTIGFEKSPDFNMDMHNTGEAKTWEGIIEPGQSAIVTVIYMPHLMPVEGSVTRSVKFSTNDPNNERVQLDVHGYVIN